MNAILGVSSLGIVWIFVLLFFLFDRNNLISHVVNCPLKEKK